MKKTVLISLAVGTSATFALWLYMKNNPDPPLIVMTATLPAAYLAENIAGKINVPSGIVFCTIMVIAISLASFIVSSVISMFKSRTRD